MANLRALARFADSLGFVYLEHAVIEREDSSLVAFTADGRVSLPAAGLSVLLLGPGTRVTHQAVAVAAGCGCLLAWVGEDGLRFYAAGQGKTRSSASLERQCAAWANPVRREAAVRRLYGLRFGEVLPAAMSLQQIRGREGARVRDAYRAQADHWGVEWSGRSYERATWAKADPVNRALSAANAALYAVCLAGLHAQGYSPALGFVHTGKQLSFVYDLADLYKLDFSVPAAFEAASQGGDGVERRARSLLRARMVAEGLVDRVPRDLATLFGSDADSVPFDAFAAEPGNLWDPAGAVPGGVQHAGDDP